MGPLIALALLALPELPHSEEGAAATVHVFRSGEAGGYATAYLVETAEGVIAVDAPLEAAVSGAARAKLAALNKPLLGVLLTQAHRDHAGGVARLFEGLAEPAPVLATAGVRDALKAAPGAVAVDRVVKDRETVTLGGARFAAHDLSAGESGSGTIRVLLVKRPAAFVGDLIVRECAPDLREGRTSAWLLQLDHARRLLYGLRTFYPGHGAPAGFAALEEERRYLLAVREAVASVAAGRAQLDEAARKELEARLNALRPGEPLGTLPGKGADAVAAELQRERAASAH